MKNSFLDKLSFLIFPPRCVVCGKRTTGENICKECFQRIEFLEYPLIEHKGRVFFYAVTNYESVAGELVRKLKFYGRKRVATDIAEIFFDFIQKNEILPDCISFVPMTKQDLCARGFNQSKLIAKRLSELSGIKLFEGIEKVRQTEKQVGLSRRKRIKNLKSAFRVSEKCRGSVLVIDDVYTTGATAHSITSAFRKQTKSDIYFVAFSRKI